MANNLTILIPTWDRPEEVNLRLKELDQVWEGMADVVIQVNPGRFLASDIDTGLYRGNILVRENSHNLGMVANVISGLAGIQTEWLWILGDDDKVLADTALQIAAGIRVADEAEAMGVLFNQWHRAKAETPIICQNIDTLLASTGFSDILFITGFVWRLSFFHANIATFVDYSFSRASQALILLASQAEGKSRIVILNHSLVRYEYIVRWSRLDYLQRITAIFTHPSLNTRSIKAQVNEILWPQCRWAFLSAAHEQLKSGEITMVEWFGAAAAFSSHLLLSSPLPTAFARIKYIFLIPLQIYSLNYLFGLVANKLSANFSRWLPLPRRPPPIRPAPPSAPRGSLRL
jgi:hypothetical protein